MSGSRDAPQNLWGDLADLEIVRTPKGILAEQADHLTKATQGVLVGKVATRGTSSGIFAYDLEVCVPRLNNYVYTILTVRHEIGLYPVQFNDDVDARPVVVCDTEEEFLQVLKEILSSREVRRILSQLLSQSK